MNEEAAMLDEELDVLEDEDIAADDEPDADDEFEYDEEGNIIIPDVVLDEGEDDYLKEEFGEEDEDEEEESSGGEDDDSEDEEESGTDAEDANTEDQAGEPDPRDARIAQLEAEIRRFKSQGKETLSKMGVENEDILEGLMSVAAEAEGVSLKEYADKKAAEEKERSQRELAKRQAFEKMARDDIAELHAAYPETQQYKDVRDMPKDILLNFGRFRDAGLTAKQAYAAANPDGIRTTAATAAKKKAAQESKSHLRSTVPKGSKDNSITMSKSELSYWRGIFPNKSDKEIQDLYKKTAN